MIKRGTKVKLYPWKIYKDDVTKSIPIYRGEDKKGKFVKCQALDINLYASTDTKKESRRTGFLYLNIYTDAKLTIGEYVTIDEIQAVQSVFIGRNRIFIATCTIQEKDCSVPIDQDNGVMIECLE